MKILDYEQKTGKLKNPFAQPGLFFGLLIFWFITLHVESIPRRVPQREGFTKWFPASQSHAGKRTTFE